MENKLGLVCLAVLTLASFAYADGIIIPHPIPPYPRPEWLEIKYHHVDILIDNQYAETQIDQVFHNPNHWDLEGDYVFPLPEGAAIRAFTMFVDGKRLEGEILDRDRARSIYEDYIKKMKDPALLEYVDRNTFKARVYPIEGHGDKRVGLSYSEIIKCDDGLCEYTYPLNTEKFSSKNLESVKVRVVIRSNIPIKSVYSPTHDVEVKRVDDYNTEVNFEANNVKPDKDFKLFYSISEKDVDINLITHKEAGEDGFFVLMLAPKFAATKDVPKDVVCVLDKSGSMAGEKISQAKEALKFILNTLKPQDRFGLVTFSTEVEQFKAQLQDASQENINSALLYIDGIQALGGTDIDSALRKALAMLRGSRERPKTIIFLTDGQPTVGVQDISQILKNIKQENNAEARIFVFGVGYEVNTRLLDKLSLENHGVATYVAPEEDLELKVSNFYTKVSSPVMNSPKIQVDGVEVYDLYPKQLPDIFKGSQILVFGRFRGLGQATIRLDGEMQGQEVGLVFRRVFEKSKNDFIPRLWASRKIGYLMDTIRLEGENDELIDEIVALSKMYGIATPYTSFLVLEDVPLEEARRRAGEAMSAAFAPTTGAGAVQASKSVSGFKDIGTAGDAAETVNGAQVKYVGSKAFVLKSGVWTDTSYTTGTETKKLKYESEAYFRTVANNPRLGLYFAIGKNLIVCASGICIEIRDTYTGIEDAIPVISEEDTCSDLENNIRWTAAALAECDTDSDCIESDVGSVAVFCCPILVNKNADLNGLHNMMSNFISSCGNDCAAMDSACPSGEIICREGFCVRRLLETPPLAQIAECGNMVCQHGETESSCPQDCYRPPARIAPKLQEDQMMNLLWLISVILIIAATIFISKKVLEKDKVKASPKPAKRSSI